MVVDPYLLAAPAPIQTVCDDEDASADNFQNPRDMLDCGSMPTESGRAVSVARGRIKQPLSNGLSGSYLQPQFLTAADNRELRFGADSFAGQQFVQGVNR